MPLITTQRWKRYGIIATSILAITTIIWNVVAYAGDKVESIASDKVDKNVPVMIEKKIVEHNVEVTEKITSTLSIIRYQMFDMEARMVKSDIKMLTQNRTTDQLTATEKSEFEFLINEQKNIQAQKLKLKESLEDQE